MKNVISARDIEVLLQGGGDVGSLPPDAILTPSARDILRDMELNPSKFGNGASAHKPGATAPPAAAPATVTSKSPQRELEAFFNS
ncbi:MAG: hypothetical protein NTW03_12770, partial [Verrucomicrobia bacterium]|nr:hypothetical protein [Verrucomicrobiota bacterium]